MLKDYSPITYALKRGRRLKKITNKFGGNIYKYHWKIYHKYIKDYAKALKQNSECDLECQKKLFG